MAAEGLTSADAAQRAREFGPNAIIRHQRVRAWVHFLRQFDSPLVWLLAAGCAIAGALGETADAAAILVIVVLNGVIGFTQERRAERAIGALRSMTAPRARVRRDGRLAIVSASTFCCSRRGMSSPPTGACSTRTTWPPTSRR